MRPFEESVFLKIGLPSMRRNWLFHLRLVHETKRVLGIDCIRPRHVEIRKTPRQISSTEIAVQEKLAAVIFQKKGEYLLPRANIFFIIIRKAHNTLRVDHCLNVRHSQTAIFIVAYETKALNFILTFPIKVVNSRIDLLNYIFWEGNKRCTMR